jgi:2-enoate reductase
MLDCFAMEFFNQRIDEYGGSLDNRLRFAKEIVEAIKTSCGPNYPVAMRFSLKSTHIKEFFNYCVLEAKNRTPFL